MEDKLNLYKDEELLKSENYVEGKATVTIDSLDADTDYPKGTYQVSRENENGESNKVDVPAFKTKPIAVTGVTLNEETLDLRVGDEQKITATVAPANATNKSVKYSSSDEEVATVDGKGNITAVAEGSADITVKTVDGGKTAKCELTVKKAVVNVTGVKLDKSTLSLEEGATGNLVATVEPSTATDKTVTFASSDKEIATVDNKGKVTAVKPGSADITVTTKDGGKTAKCELTVTAKTIAVTGVTIEPKTASVDVDATTKLNSTVAPSTATNKSVSYKSSDEAVATVSSNGTVTGVAEGEATITVTTQDGNKTDTATVTVNPVEEPEPEPDPEEPGTEE